MSAQPDDVRLLRACHLPTDVIVKDDAGVAFVSLASHEAVDFGVRLLKQAMLCADTDEERLALMQAMLAGVADALHALRAPRETLQ